MSPWIYMQQTYETGTDNNDHCYYEDHVSMLFQSQSSL